MKNSMIRLLQGRFQKGPIQIKSFHSLFFFLQGLLWDNWIS